MDEGSLGSTLGVWPTMLQSAKRGASSLPLSALIHPHQRAAYVTCIHRECCVYIHVVDDCVPMLGVLGATVLQLSSGCRCVNKLVF